MQWKIDITPRYDATRDDNFDIMTALDFQWYVLPGYITPKYAYDFVELCSAVW